MRCPSCLAHNADGATFCTLCHTSFAVQPEVAATPEATPQPDPDPSGPLAHEVGRPPSMAKSTKGTFRKTEEGFDWKCPRCQEWSPLEVTRCHVCDLDFRKAMGEDTGPQPVTSEAASTALLLSVLAPGMGHISVGRTALGLSRLALFLMFFVGGLLILMGSTGSAASLLATVPLFIGALVIWLATFVDMRSLAAGHETSVLPPRAYLWLVVGVMVSTSLATIPAVMDANQRDDAPEGSTRTQESVPEGPGSPAPNGTLPPPPPSPSDEVTSSPTADPTG